MKSVAVASVLFAATAQSMTPVPRHTSQYDVFNFQASCIRHSLMCTYDFRVVAAETSLYPTRCPIQAQGPDYLPPVKLRACENIHYSWAVGKENDTLALTITTILNPTTNLTGVHVIGKDELAVDDNGSVMTQYYTGPQNFSIPVQKTPV